jgi:putative peptidoglycan lipid II flippase
MIFAGAAYTLVGIMQSHDRFLLPSLVSAVSNLILILYLAFCSKPIGMTSAVGFACAYVLSWMAQFLTLAVPLWRKQAFPHLTPTCKTADTVLAVKRALPVMFGSWLIPMISLIAKSFCSFVNPADIESGAYTGAAIVIYENAFSVFAVAAGLLTYGVCNYMFPKLSERFAAGDAQSFARLLQRGFFVSFAMLLPASGALFLLADEIVSVLYLRGGFTEGLAASSGESLKMLALALPSYGMTEFFSRAFYACGKVRYPMLASLSGISVALVACGVLVVTEQISIGTVSLSVALAQTAAGLLLLIFSRYAFENKKISRSNGKKYVFLLAGNMLCFAAMRFCRDFLRQIFHFSQTFRNFLIITIVFAIGFVVYSIWMLFADVICKCNLRTEYKNL